MVCQRSLSELDGHIVGDEIFYGHLLLLPKQLGGHHLFNGTVRYGEVVKVILGRRVENQAMGKIGKATAHRNLRNSMHQVLEIATRLIQNCGWQNGGKSGSTLLGRGLRLGSSVILSSLAAVAEFSSREIANLGLFMAFHANVGGTLDLGHASYTIAAGKAFFQQTTGSYTERPNLYNLRNKNNHKNIILKLKKQLYFYIILYLILQKFDFVNYVNMKVFYAVVFSVERLTVTYIHRERTRTVSPFTPFWNCRDIQFISLNVHM